MSNDEHAWLNRPIVADASTLVEWLGVFRLPEQSRWLISAVAEHQAALWVPDLAYAEAASALRSLALRGELEPSEATRGIDLLLALPLSVASAATFLRDTWTLRDRMTIYDATYVALAQRLGGTLVTADERLVRACDQVRGRVAFLGDLPATDEASDEVPLPSPRGDP